MKIIFMGTPDPAALCLKALIEAKEDVIAVITQPDRPKGRGLKIVEPPVKKIALHYNIPVHQPERIKDATAIKLINDLEPDLIIVVAYGKILPKEIIDAPQYGTINVHASLLPKYRGAAPVQWAIMNGEKETGITIMKVIEELDAGDIILQGKMPIEKIDNTQTLTKKLFELGAKLLLLAVEQIKIGKVKYLKQDEKKVSLAPTLLKEAGMIDWKDSAEMIFDQIRACNPWPVAHTFINGKMFKIFWADVISPSGSKPGEVLEILKDRGFIIGTGEGSLLIREVQTESGRRMSAMDFLVGHKISVGEKLPN
jgi:methionyl-tRNA formyltransferase